MIGPDLGSTSLTATVDLASIDTANADRDAHVRSDDIVDVARRPTLTYRSTAIVPDGDGWRVEGEATIGGVTVPVALAVELGGVELYPLDERHHAGFEARGELRRSDFGIAPQLPTRDARRRRSSSSSTSSSSNPDPKRSSGVASQRHALRNNARTRCCSGC